MQLCTCNMLTKSSNILNYRISRFAARHLNYVKPLPSDIKFENHWSDQIILSMFEFILQNAYLKHIVAGGKTWIRFWKIVDVWKSKRKRNKFKRTSWGWIIGTSPLISRKPSWAINPESLGKDERMGHWSSPIGGKNSKIFFIYSSIRSASWEGYFQKHKN